MIDDRYTAEDHAAAEMTSLSALKASLSSRLKSLKFIQLSMYINKAYSLRYGYQLFLSDMSEFKDFLKKNPNRHTVWLKPNFIEATMMKHPECEWISFLDSDSYMWMDKHETSLNDFFSTATIHDATYRYDEYEYEMRVNDGYYPWKDQKFLFMIGLDGIFQKDMMGWPSPVNIAARDFSCAGVFFVKNNDDGQNLIRQWIHGPDNATADQMETFNHFGFNWAREQSVLNRLILPLYVKDVAYYSYRDFGYIDGQGINHVWTQFKDKRMVWMQRVLKDLKLIDAGESIGINIG